MTMTDTTCTSGADILRLRPQAYIAGPMRGIPEFNFPAFDEAAAILGRSGILTFNPAERDRAAGFDPTGLEGTQQELDDAGFDMRATLAADLDWLCLQADMVVLLEGWMDSQGAFAETAVARALGIPIYPLDHFHSQPATESDPT